MAKEMSVTCDFIEKQLVFKLPEQMMDVLLKIRTKTGEHTFREDVYTHTLKYCRWNNQLKPFRSLKRRVANIFRKRNSISDDSRGTSMQSIVNHMDRDSEERSVVGDNKRKSIHSDWSDLISIDEEAEYRKKFIRVGRDLILQCVLLLCLLFWPPKLLQYLLLPQLRKQLKT